MEVKPLKAIYAGGDSTALGEMDDTDTIPTTNIPALPYAAPLGPDDNYVTDTEKSNLHAPNSDAETATTIGALIGGAADATPNDTDFVATSLTAGGILKKITWTNVKAFLKTYFDTLYQAVIGNDTNISGLRHHLSFNIIDPLSVQTEDNEICLIPKLDAAITITNIEVTLDATTNQVAGDLKYADNFISLANPVVINDFDTTSGVRSDNSITSGSVAAGKCLYLAFDSAPNTAIHQMSVDITYDYN